MASKKSVAFGYLSKFLCSILSNACRLKRNVFEIFVLFIILFPFYFFSATSLHDLDFFLHESGFLFRIYICMSIYMANVFQNILLAYCFLYYCITKCIFCVLLFVLLYCKMYFLRITFCITVLQNVFLPFIFVCLFV